MPIRTQFGPFSIIVGLDEAGGYSKDGKIPWIDNPFGKEDLKHFQKITKGGICIMGRNTYDDMLKKKKSKDIEDILPNRQSFVVTSRGGDTPGVQKVGGLREAIYELDENDKREIFILGGVRLFTESMPFVNNIYISLIPGDYKCDSFFPINSFGKFRIVNGSKFGDLKFINYQRR